MTLKIYPHPLPFISYLLRIYQIFFAELSVTQDQLKEVALHSGVLEVEEDFLDTEFRSKCEEIIPYPDKVEPSDCKNAFLYLKERFLENVDG